MTDAGREELLALLEGLPDDRLRRLLDELRQERGRAKKRPLVELVPISDEDAAEMMAAIAKAFGQVNPDAW